MSIDAWIHGQIVVWAKGPKHVDLADFIAKCVERVVKAKWRVCFQDRGMGHGSYGVSARVGKQVVLIVGDLSYKDLAQHICDAHSTSR